MNSLLGNRLTPQVLLALVIYAALGVTAVPVWAQEEATAAAPREVDGVHLYSLSGTFEYSSIPVAFINTANPSVYGPEYAGVIGTSVGFTHRFARSRNRFAITYNPTYNRYFTYAGLNSFNQNLVLEFTSRIGAHWNFALSATGEDATLDQYLFAPNALTLTSGTDGLAGAISSTSAVTQSAVQAALYGIKRLSVTGNASLAYHPSTRWTILARADAVDSTSRGTSQNQAVAALIPHVFTAEGYLNASYGVTPTTILGVEGGVMQSRSAFADYQVSSLRLSLRKTFARKWFALVDGGGGKLTSLDNSINGPHGLSYLYSGSLGYGGRENSFAASYSRQLGDYIGFASGSTTSLNGYWNWRTRNRSWGLTATGGRQRLSGSSLGNLTVYEASLGATRALGKQATMTVSYVDLTETASSVRAGTFTVHAVRVGVVWIPFLREVARLNRAVVLN